MTYEDLGCSTSEPWLNLCEKNSTSSKPFLHQETARGTKQSTPNHPANSKDPATQNPSWTNKVEYHATTAHCRIFVQIFLVQKWWKNETNTIANKIGECECACNLHMGIGIYTVIWKLLEQTPWVMDLWALKHLHHWRHQPWRKGNHQLQASAAVPKWRQHQRRSGTLQIWTIFDGICFICCLNLWIYGLLLLNSRWNPGS